MNRHALYLLAAAQHFAPKELADTLRAMVSWGVRGLVIGGIGGGVAERTYCDAAVAIRSGSSKNAGDLFKDLSAIVGSDAEFESSFATARVTRGTLARYMLIALERAERGDSEPELVPNSDETEVNLEHVLPKNASSQDWPLFDEEDMKAQVHRLGNMVLLRKTHNNQIGNKPFLEKKSVLASSELRLTKEAGQESDWSPSVIAARQARLASIAAKTWPGKP